MSGNRKGNRQNLTLENVLASAMKTPVVKIDRANFLRKELKKYCSDDVIENAITFNPAKAGISRDVINKVAMSVIDYETNKVTLLSVGASLSSSAVPVMAAGAATVDITSYFAFVLRVVQELAYLYGFGEFDLNDASVDSDTMNCVQLFMGTMFGVKEANAALGKFADAAARHVARNLRNRALTKGVIYPVVRQVARRVGIRMTKQIFADTVASAIPFVGSLVSGGLTYVMFKPNCLRLREKLAGYRLSDPEYYKMSEGEEVVVDVEAVEVE